MGGTKFKSPIITAVWDFESDISALTQLVQDLSREHGVFKTVALCSHGCYEALDGENASEKWWMLTSSHGVELNSGRTDDGFTEAIQAIAAATSVRVDLLACDLAGSERGQEFVQYWKELTKVNFAASTDVS